MSLSKILSLGEQDRVIRGQVERITYHANSQEPVVKNVIRDRVTEDMVDTFNKQFRKPIEKEVYKLDAYDRPIVATDEHGNEITDAEGNLVYETQKKEFKYRTPQMDLDLEAVDRALLEPVLSERDLEDNIQATRRLVDAINKNEHDMLDLKKQIEEKRQLINTIADDKGVSDRDKKRTIFATKLVISHHELQIEAKKRQNVNYGVQYDRYRKQYQDNEPNVLKNQGIIKSVMKRNEDKVNAYSNELTSLNSGQFAMDKRPDETNEEFAERLKDVGETEYQPEDEYEGAYLSNMNQFKTNMKSITRDDALIDSVMRTLTAKQLYNLNKVFTLFKSEFLKVFGAFNKDINFEDVSGAIKIFLKTGSYHPTTLKPHPPSTKRQAEVTKKVLIAGKFDYFTINDDKTMAIQNTTTNNVVYFKISKTRGTSANKDMVILFSNTGQRNSFVSIGFRMTAYRKQQKPEQSSKHVFEDNLGLSEDDMYDIFKTTKPSLSNLVGFFKNYIKETPASEIINLSNTTEEYGQFRNESVYGWGIKPNETLPKTCEFGKVIIELDKLYYKNILAVKDKKMRNITGFKNAPVSNEFVEIVMNMCRNNTLPNKSELQQLNSSNKELWDLLIHYSGLHKSNVDSSKSETIQKLKERLSLVEGEMEAGNNNPELVDELRGLLFKLKNLDVITTYQAKQHFKQLTTNL